MFFDESESITQKNEPRVAQGNSVADSTSLDLDQSSAILVRSASTTPPVTLTDFVLYQPMEDVGLNFFMSHYIGNDPSVSILHYLPDFYSKSGYANSGLQYTLTATGLAGVRTRTTIGLGLHPILTRYSTQKRQVATMLSQSRRSTMSLRSVVSTRHFRNLRLLLKIQH